MSGLAAARNGPAFRVFAAMAARASAAERLRGQSDILEMGAAGKPTTALGCQRRADAKRPEGTRRFRSMRFKPTKTSWPV
jgi:hypothetical protein